MKERPILFSGPMVHALLNGTKTQTRRVVKPQPTGEIQSISCGFVESYSGKEMFGFCGEHQEWPCPYGQPGDRLWVRETFQPLWENEAVNCDYQTGQGYKINYVATGGIKTFVDADTEEMKETCTPSIFMPRWASRITLEVKKVRVERLQAITEADAEAEGCQPCSKVGDSPEHQSARDDYRSLWESINGPGSWDANPWVWVIEFKSL